jgi:hypothetical protein
VSGYGSKELFNDGSHLRDLSPIVPAASRSGALAATLLPRLPLR